jgi:hypothetical protein
MLKRATLLFAALPILLSVCGSVRAQVPACVTADAMATQIQTRILQCFTCTNLEVQVVPFDDPSYTQQGRVQWITISADLLSQGPFNIQKVFVKSFDVTLDLNKLFAPHIVVTHTACARSIVTACITEEDLNEIVGPNSSLAKNSGIEDLKMTILPGAIKITGKYHPLFDADLELIGTLSVSDHRNVNFEPTSATFNGIPLPAGLLKVLLRKMNPVVDFHDVPLEPSIDQVVVDDHRVLVTG